VSQSDYQFSSYRSPLGSTLDRNLTRASFRAESAARAAAATAALPTSASSSSLRRVRHLLEDSQQQRQQAAAAAAAASSTAASLRAAAAAAHDPRSARLLDINPAGMPSHLFNFVLYTMFTTYTLWIMKISWRPIL
jgi:hypothetical protein